MKFEVDINDKQKIRSVQFVYDTKVNKVSDRKLDLIKKQSF